MHHPHTVVDHAGSVIRVRPPAVSCTVCEFRSRPAASGRITVRSVCGLRPVRCSLHSVIVRAAFGLGVRSRPSACAGLGPVRCPHHSAIGLRPPALSVPCTVCEFAVSEWPRPEKLALAHCDALPRFAHSCSLAALSRRPSLRSARGCATRRLRLQFEF